MLDLPHVLANVLLLGGGPDAHLGRGQAGRSGVKPQRTENAGAQERGEAPPPPPRCPAGRLPQPVSFRSAQRMPSVAKLASLTWMCSSVKMVCSCIWGTGVLVATDTSRICLKTCNR